MLGSSGAPVPLEEYTPLYARYQKPALLERVFVDPDKRVPARALLEQLVKEQQVRDAQYAVGRSVSVSAQAC